MLEYGYLIRRKRIFTYSGLQIVDDGWQADISNRFDVTRSVFLEGVQIRLQILSFLLLLKLFALFTSFFLKLLIGLAVFQG